MFNLLMFDSLLINKHIYNFDKLGVCTIPITLLWNILYAYSWLINKHILSLIVNSKIQSFAWQLKKQSSMVGRLYLVIALRRLDMFFPLDFDNSWDNSYSIWLRILPPLSWKLMTQLLSYSYSLKLFYYNTFIAHLILMKIPLRSSTFKFNCFKIYPLVQLMP